MNLILRLCILLGLKKKPEVWINPHYKNAPIPPTLKERFMAFFRGEELYDDIIYETREEYEKEFKIAFCRLVEEGLITLKLK